MPLVKRSELLKVVETFPGQEATPVWAGAHAVDVIDVQYSPQRTVNPRQLASPSISRSFESIGRSSVGVTFGVDAKGSGTATVLPNYDDFLQACLMRQEDIVVLVLQANPAFPILPGDILTGGTSGAKAMAMMRISESPIIPVWIVSGTFANAENVTSLYRGDQTAGVSHASAPTPGTVVAKRWRPITQPLATFNTTAVWGGGNPAAGESFKSTTALGVVEGGGIISSIDTTTTTAEWTWGVLTAASALLSSSGKTATVATPHAFTQVIGKTLTMRPNRGGLARPVFGARGSWSLTAEAGGQSRFNFAFTGKHGIPVDAAPVSGATFPTTVPPRLIGGYAVVDGLLVPVRSIQTDLNNSVVMHADANSAEGDIRAEITNREPSMTIELDQLGLAAIDWYARWRTSTRVRLALQLGATAGNIITVIAPNGQITEVADGDQDGIATHTVTVQLRQDTSAGNDELHVGHL